MLVTTNYYRFAAAYGEGAYGECTYNCGTEQSTSTGSTGSNSSSLTDTGIAVAGIITLACLIALVAILVRVWRRPARPVPQESPVEGGEWIEEEGTPRS
jgi:hypothetical protein